MIIEAKTLLISLALITPRAFVCMAILPGFGTRTLVGVMRNAVSMAIALPALIPTYAAVQELPPDLIMAMIFAFKEAALGAIIGTMLALPIWVMQSVGTVIDLQRTPVLTQNINPSQDQDASALGTLLLQAAVLVMIEAGLYLALTKTLLDSYAAWPVLSLAPPFELAHMQLVIERLGSFLGHVVVYSAPVMIPLLLVEFAFAVLGVFAPSLQASMAASPVKSLVALVILLLYWATLAHFVGSDFSHQLDLLRTLYLKT